MINRCCSLFSGAQRRRRQCWAGAVPRQAQQPCCRLQGGGLAACTGSAAEAQGDGSSHSQLKEGVGTHSKSPSTPLTRALYHSRKMTSKSTQLFHSGEETSLDLAVWSTRLLAGVGGAAQKERQAEEKVLFLLSVDKPQNSLRPSSKV